ncbi:MAG: hypothetical protein QXE19_04870 [Candidatus Bathyarchaeia archaeon]
MPYGLVPISSLGKFAKVPTKTIDTLIHLASIIAQVDFNIYEVNLTWINRFKH